ncbi:MerR family transcriptional regulator [Nocardiopsis suaedae]|uniref:MerR family transcriptional regulator n=1 Tax=Nocardiopsis suaedae TaxID=3018444 RepID=A0ABT4TH31_9ACTN|nr:MerR family transcriptional regulator [Nocardiopsis suaedae]MDA2803382.1 MerR family transcriptional regulator [Nocardiopsis suaedae]
MTNEPVKGGPRRGRPTTDRAAPDGLTIGQAASFAEVTVKAVRHYHRIGLLDEPPRDGSGYRRYGATEVLRLVRIRTLAAAGVPLAEIGPMLEYAPERFTEALADVEARLDERIEELTARRAMLRRLADGDLALLPDRAAVLLERGRAAGLPPEELAATREGMVLARALDPDAFDDYLGNLEEALGDPQVIALHRRAQEALAWEPDDPRLEEVATAMAEYVLARPAMRKVVTSFQKARTAPTDRYRLISRFGNQTPTGAHLLDLIEARLRSGGVFIP